MEMSKNTRGFWSPGRCGRACGSLVLHACPSDVGGGAPTTPSVAPPPAPSSSVSLPILASESPAERENSSKIPNAASEPLASCSLAGCRRTKITASSHPRRTAATVAAGDTRRPRGAPLQCSLPAPGLPSVGPPDRTILLTLPLRAQAVAQSRSSALQPEPLVLRAQRGSNAAASAAAQRHGEQIAAAAILLPQHEATLGHRSAGCPPTCCG